MSMVPLGRRVERVDVEWACQNEVHSWSIRISRLRRSRRQEESRQGARLLKASKVE
jgi:hypothetical protein